MVFSLIILYVVTLVYISTTERFRNYAAILALQGVLLMGIALFRLHSINIASLLFVVLETLVFKAIVVPSVLFYIIRRSRNNRIRHSGSSQFNSLMLSVGALVASAWITYAIADNSINMVFFGVSLYALLSGFILIVLRSKIFSHMVGFLVIENGVFLFSMAIGVHMPFLIEIAILLDIIISILMLGLLVTKMASRIKVEDANQLTNVKD